MTQHNPYGQPFGVQKSQQRALINAPRFIKAFRITDRIKEHKLIGEQRERPGWRRFCASISALVTDR